MSKGKQLREAMANGLVVAPFVYDGFTAKIARRHGAKAIYMSGFGTAAQLGMPDVGLTSFAEMVDNLRYVAGAVDVPVIADADTGYGNPVNARRTVREYEEAGAAALHLEDQVFPKKCGFFAGKQVVPKEEHVYKIQAALDARQDPEFVIIARTDALAPNGWPDAIDRCLAYHKAGADLVFVDGIRTLEDLDIYQRELVGQGVACLYNGGLEPTARVAARGFRVMITGSAHRLSYAAFRHALLEIKSTGGTGQPRNADQFRAITDLLGLPEVYELERRYASAASGPGRSEGS
ncbi:MAG: isocitrate lyase/PEP mutase family protein [Candidatus Rokubacteria bacterium]|nr:isocitrate lyase/PEP mutase family protein [Candidatus Rokubacteria bacterium]